MHILLGLLAILGVAALWYYRVRAARDSNGDLTRGGGDVRVAARRVKYKDGHDAHPADSVDDPRLAAAGIAVAVATMDKPISQAEIAALTRTSRETFEVSEREALDIVSFGRWIASQCTTNQDAVDRLSKVVAQQAGPEAAGDLVRIVTEVATADGGALGEDEMAALDTVRRTLGVA